MWLRNHVIFSIVLLIGTTTTLGGSGVLSFTEIPPTMMRRGNSGAAPSTRLYDSKDEKAEPSFKPTLVVGATGRVGRIIVRTLLEQSKPVRALVRDVSKAREVFGDNPNLELVVVPDLGLYREYSRELEKAVDGCEAVISVSGTVRFSKITDFMLPWRFLRTDVSSWADSSHPYFCNYKAQCFLVDLAEKYNVKRFVRLTGLSTGYSIFNPVTVIFSSLLSLTTRYHFLCEKYLHNSRVPHVIVRPGALMDGERVSYIKWKLKNLYVTTICLTPRGMCILLQDPSTTRVQVSPMNDIPPPGRVYRSDVAALCIAACGLEPENTYTLGVRAVGEIDSKIQGSLDAGFETIEEALDKVVQSKPPIWTYGNSKPVGPAVAIFVYSLALITFTILKTVLSKLLGQFVFGKLIKFKST
jgi:hypothetical protein